MSLTAIILIVLLIALFGGLAPWGNYGGPGHFYGTGYYGGGVGLILLIVLLLVLFGRL